MRWACLGAAALLVACGDGSKSGDDGGSGGGSGGGGGGKNYVFGQLRQGDQRKLDLLVMVDNSPSMADKQHYLAQAIPLLVSRLVTPRCVDENGEPVGGSAPCPSGSGPEFAAVEDIHVGVITSSLGDHGSGDLCSDALAETGDTPNDGASLVPAVRPGTPSWNDWGFLVWDPRDGVTSGPRHEPPGYGSPLPGSPGGVQDMLAAFTDHIQAAGERGCGHEAQLESWYRFLVDPEPVSGMTRDGNFGVRGPVSQVVLDQRARFLRPDSVLAIVMLTDENDCSFLDEERSQGWVAMYTGGSSGGFQMPRATSACVDPNSPDCLPCAEDPTDAACSAEGNALTAAEDNPNLRCFHMKERFGIDLKYPLSRYVEALTSRTIDPRRTRDPVPNPIFSGSPGGVVPRDPADVVMLGIVGVPWQDIATDGSTPGTPDSLDPGSRTLQFMSAAELEANDRWVVILGGADGNGPTDPFMIESVDPRPPGSPHPFLPGVAVAEPGGTLNPVNGTEQAVPPSEPFDLQFACTFPLDPPVPCTMQNERGCACNASEYAQRSPLCEYAAPDAEGIQVRAKAYPSVRELELLRALGDNAVVASICPKNVTPVDSAATDPTYGYNPAISALVARLEQSFATPCLPRPLVSTDGRVSCTVMEVEPSQESCETCAATPGRREVPNGALRAALGQELERRGLCGGSTSTSCDRYCACEIEQLAGDDLAACQQETTVPEDLHGFCYVDEENGAPELLAACPVENKRRLRFVGSGTPALGTTVYLACGS
jgi:hypothetical protein